MSNFNLNSLVGKVHDNAWWSFGSAVLAIVAVVGVVGAFVLYIRPLTEDMKQVKEEVKALKEQRDSDLKALKEVVGTVRTFQNRVSDLELKISNFRGIKEDKAKSAEDLRKDVAAFDVDLNRFLSTPQVQIDLQRYFTKEVSAQEYLFVEAADNREIKSFRAYEAKMRAKLQEFRKFLDSLTEVPSSSGGLTDSPRASAVEFPGSGEKEVRRMASKPVDKKVDIACKPVPVESSSLEELTQRTERVTALLKAQNEQLRAKIEQQRLQQQYQSESRREEQLHACYSQP